jgi:hypothetical protein
MQRPFKQVVDFGLFFNSDCPLTSWTTGRLQKRCFFKLNLWCYVFKSLFPFWRCYSIITICIFSTNTIYIGVPAQKPSSHLGYHGVIAC